MKTLHAAGNTIVPAICALEDLGFVVTFEVVADDHVCRVERNGEQFVGPDPVTVLGLVKLVELRGQDGWQCSDAEVESVLARYRLG